MASTYKLTYFNFQGLAEVARYLMKYGGIDFEDERLEYDNWANLKSGYTFGQLPVLTIDGVQYNQSVAFSRYLANKVDLAGSNELEKLEIDAIVDTINDMRLKLVPFFQSKDDETKNTIKEQFLSEHLPYYFERLEKIVEKNDGHLSGKKLTWADFYFTAVAELFINAVGFDNLDHYSNLKKVVDTVTALPAIKAWIAVRPKTPL